MQSKQVKGFTLIELLIVIGIIAILATVVILTLNPAELLRQARDSNRVSDLSNLQSALSFYLTDVSSPLGANGLGMGNTAYCYASLPNVTGTGAWGDVGNCYRRFGSSTTPTGIVSTSTRLVNGTGWIPVNFALISGGNSPISILPVDPVQPNATNTERGAFYAYRVSTSSGISFEINADLESAKFASSSENDGGNDSGLLEVGTFPGLNL